MPPIGGKEHALTIISRSSVERARYFRAPRAQDGRSAVKYNGLRAIDFRVSIMPSIHGEDAVLRVLDKDR